MAQMSKKELKELRKLEKLQQQTLSQKQNTTKWVALSLAAALFLVLFVGLVIIGKNRNNPQTNGITASFAEPGHERMVANNTDKQATAGGEQAEKMVTMVEYADFQCPACKQYHPIVKSLLELYPGQLKLIFKHFPLTSIHPNALPAAKAAEAAGRQNKFFEMADLMYERQGEWSSLADPIQKFVEYAKELGLDVNKFTTDMKDPAIAQTIEAQQNEGIKNGVNSTPSFFIEGKKIANPGDIAGFQKIIDAELEAKKGVSSEKAPQPTKSTSLPLSE